MKLRLQKNIYNCSLYPTDGVEFNKIFNKIQNATHCVETVSYVNTGIYISKRWY